MSVINRGHELAIATQARLLGIARSTVYREPQLTPAADLAVMRRIDELHLNYPFAGSRMLRSMLVNEGLVIGRTHVRTLMRRMGIEAPYRRPRTSKPAPGHKMYPYLLRDVAATRSNQVWAADITYIPMAITGAAFTGLLLKNGVAISMDGKGAWRDNVFFERLWRTAKYEEVYIRAYDTVAEARGSIRRYLDSYNAGRPHSKRGGQTPDQVWFANSPPLTVAA